MPEHSPEPTHSPTPWRVSKSGSNAGDILDANGRIVCEETAMIDENFAHMIACVKALAGLNPEAVGALRNATLVCEQTIAELLKAEQPWSESTKVDWTNLKAARRLAGDALALAKPERKVKQA